MRFSASFILSGLLATGALAAPAAVKRAGVLTKQSYADFQISDGVAGNAQAEVLQKFPIDMNDLANVDPADQQIISGAREVAESAETDAFNPAIDAASGADATALQNGKIKNKVLKLQLEVMDLMISQAQGEDNADKIAEETTKLNTNIGLDSDAAGQASQSVQFDG
ncbi:hypothetical protein BU26DRAFT_568063 [Trematosphaeria pertusa]|uniref:Small secreted protein n=1 Tax=Trematosphaeria pertusa TaxID=390896 RepID=A0A6A6I5H4_9PLEO|nr:uncharacterized protein BU26DRAFT_568063 [Trematosphaeria pertusa]KAF2245479.1 hypothetical protein BU26DRAFT_568063 [Trematosphaeria pertusa]